MPPQPSRLTAEDGDGLEQPVAQHEAAVGGIDPRRVCADDAVVQIDVHGTVPKTVSETFESGIEALQQRARLVHG
ncbi:MAG: hypothetical protein QF902_12270, partial [Rhodospirillales bacterium]|nr:hypothetical protein [Rhodospirillales bacterium]